jgi:hypothetical protein
MLKLVEDEKLEYMLVGYILATALPNADAGRVYIARGRSKGGERAMRREGGRSQRPLFEMLLAEQVVAKSRKRCETLCVARHDSSSLADF